MARAEGVACGGIAKKAGIDSWNQKISYLATFYENSLGKSAESKRLL